MFCAGAANLVQQEFYCSERYAIYFLRFVNNGERRSQSYPDLTEYLGEGNVSSKKNMEENNINKK